MIWEKTRYVSLRSDSKRDPSTAKWLPTTELEDCECNSTALGEETSISSPLILDSCQTLALTILSLFFFRNSTQYSFPPLLSYSPFPILFFPSLSFFVSLTVLLLRRDIVTMVGLIKESIWLVLASVSEIYTIAFIIGNMAACKQHSGGEAEDSSTSRPTGSRRTETLGLA